MTTPPKRLTAEEEADAILAELDSEADYCACPYTDPHDGTPQATAKRIIAAAIRQRDELYAKAWEECKHRRGPRFSVVDIGDATDAHDTLRREAGKEKA